ncbi:hypothetical protein E1B28_005784 [Marasmius oreades]|uniref:BTB domain-containing protein n=1 Tax=Marasmius oreades TaxID=181124 RepID=A0A9P7S4K5_9AGAR|nr:uncharacterized protein E1B28_005784 [Marasmius oreades]KAG7094987.1 hypothetical protein E1B28_005784 [Marasmius oreades]
MPGEKSSCLEGFSSASHDFHTNDPSCRLMESPPYHEHGYGPPSNTPPMVSLAEGDINWEQSLCYPTPNSSVDEDQRSHPSTESSEGAHEHSLDKTTTSATFYPGANTYYIPSDLVCLSSDMVAFYVHSELLLATSDNHFHSLVVGKDLRGTRRTVIHVPEQSAILNIVLHAVYGLSATRYAPTFDELSRAVDRLEAYGVHPSTEITAASALHSTLLSHAHVDPMKVYLLAAKHDIFDLAVSTSSHLLSFPLNKITEDIAIKMGPKYMTRLFSLHRGRLVSLKRLLSLLPHLHPPSPKCNLKMQNTMARAWKLASAYLLWQDRPDLSSNYIDAVFRTLPEHVSCELCKWAFQCHIQTVTAGWRKVQSTI